MAERRGLAKLVLHIGNADPALARHRAVAGSSMARGAGRGVRDDESLVEAAYGSDRTSFVRGFFGLAGILMEPAEDTNVVSWDAAKWWKCSLLKHPARGRDPTLRAWGGGQPN